MLFSRREAPSLKAMVGNAKKRSTLIFDNCIDWQIYKGFTADQAEIEREPPSAVVIGLVLGSLATTDRGRWYARLMYSAENPSCKDVYSRFFDALSVTKEGKGDAYPIVDHFYQYSLDHSVTIDLGDDLIHHLADQWGAITRALSECGPEDDIDAKTLADRAVDLGTVLRSPDGFPNERVVGYIELIRDGRRCLRNHSATYRALRDLAFLGKSTNKAVRDTGSERLELIRTMDTFFRACEQSSNQTGRSPVMTCTGTGGIADML